MLAAPEDIESLTFEVLETTRTSNFWLSLEVWEPSGVCRKSFGNSSRSVSCSTRSLAALMLSTEKYQLTAFSNSNFLMGWEIRAILRIPMVQPMPMTPAYTTRSAGRP